MCVHFHMCNNKYTNIFKQQLETGAHLTHPESWVPPGSTRGCRLQTHLHIATILYSLQSTSKSVTPSDLQTTPGRPKKVGDVTPTL